MQLLHNLSFDEKVFCEICSNVLHKETHLAFMLTSRSGRERQRSAVEIFYFILFCLFIRCRKANTLYFKCRLNTLYFLTMNIKKSMLGCWSKYAIQGKNCNEEFPFFIIIEHFYLLSKIASSSQSTLFIFIAIKSILNQKKKNYKEYYLKSTQHLLRCWIE